LPPADAPSRPLPWPKAPALAIPVNLLAFAAVLAGSPKAVENHRTNIVATLGLSGANALLQFAVRNRLKL